MNNTIGEMPQMNMEIPKLQELTKLFDLKELRDITASVSKLSEADVRVALVMALLLNQQNKDLDNTRLQQIHEVKDQLAESKKEISQLQGHINAKLVDALPSPADYDLPIQEHNMAVIVRFSFRTTPPEYAEYYIRQLFAPDRENRLDKSAESFLLDLRREFTRLFREEKRAYGFIHPRYDAKTDTVSFKENPETPAINAICTFKMKNPVLDYTGDKPNLGNVYSIKPDEIVKNPSENFLRFLHDLADYYACQRRKAREPEGEVSE
ncbi:MAG: hypothetical protein LUH52_05585 [Bacteroides uniformis]|nr:hypothetical protein [Bacteroides uniformis]